METAEKCAQLSHPQLRIYYSEQLHPGTNSQSLAISYVLKQTYNVELLSEAIRYISTNCDALNTQFSLNGNDPEQSVDFGIASDIAYFDFEGQADEQAKWLATQVVQPIDLKKGPLYTFSIYRNSAGNTCIFLNAHHIIMDAFSWGLIIEQVLAIAEQLRSGERPSYRLLPYEEFLTKESNYKVSADFEADRSFWIEKFKHRSLDNYFFDQSRIYGDTTSTRKQLLLDPSTSDQIRAFIREEKTSTFRFFMGITSVVLSKIFGKRELTFGTPYHNRSDEELQQIVGMLVNILPFHVDLNEQLRFNELLQLVKTELKSNLTHQHYPYDLLVRDVQEKTASRGVDELFDVVLNYQNYVYPDSVQSVDWHHTSVDNYPMIFHVSERGAGSRLLLEIDSRKNYCSDAEVDLLFDLFQSAIEQVLVNPQVAIADIDLLAGSTIDTETSVSQEGPIWNYCTNSDGVTDHDYQKALLYHQKNKEREFWSDILSRHDFVFFKKEDSGNEDKTASKINFEFSKEISSRLIKIANGSNERLHIILSACLLVLFKNFTKKDQVAIATSLFSKGIDENLINTLLPVFGAFEAEDSIKDVILSTIANLNQAIKHQNYPIAYLIEQDILSGEQRATNFDVRVFLKGVQDIPNVPIRDSKLAFVFDQKDGLIRCEVVYRADAIQDFEAEALIANLQVIGKTLITDINAKIRDLSLPHFNRYQFGVVGYDALALSATQLLWERNHAISWVVTSPGSQLEQFARENKLPAISANDTTELNKLSVQNLDFVLDLSDFSTPEIKLSDSNIRRIRYHDSLLQGSLNYDATSEALLAGQKEHGMSWYLESGSAEELKVLGQSLFSITNTDTTASLLIKGIDQLMQTFPQVVIDLEQDKSDHRTVKLDAASKQTALSKTAIGALSFDVSAEDVELFFRTLNFESNNNPIALPKIVLSDACIVVKQLQVLGSASKKAPGTIIDLEEGVITVATKTNDVEIEIAKVFKQDQAKAFELRLGMTLTTDPESLDTFNALQQELRTYESYWLERIRYAKPVTLPLPVFSRKSNEVVIGKQVIELTDQKIITGSNLTQADQTLIGLLAFLVRVTEQDQYSVKYRDTTLNTETQHVFSSVLPLEIQADVESNFAAFEAQAKSILAQIRQAKTFQNDLFDRYPTLLSDVSGIEEISGISIIVGSDVEINAAELQHDQFQFVINAAGNTLECYYDKNLIREQLATEVKEQIIAFFGAIYEQPEKSLNQLPLVNQQEHNRILNEFNDSEYPYTKDQRLDEFFETAAEKYADNVALVDESGSITYWELNEKANQLAHQLVADGLVAEQPVAIITDRSFEMIISVIATLKAGGTYIPIDLTQPIQRMKQILNSVRPAHLIVYKIEPTILSQLQTEQEDIKYTYDLAGNGVAEANTFSETVEIDQINRQSTANLPLIGTPEDIAYVIHTSGSTGVPKGVVVKHRPVLNILEWVINRYNITETDRLLFVTSIGFDLSVFDLFGILSTGASLQIAPQSDIQDPRRLCELLSTYPITIWDSAPGTLQQIAPYLELVTNRSQLRLAMLSGDWISLSLPPALKEHFDNIHVLSMGGATEATIWSNYFDVTELDPDWKSVPYGKPIQNCKYFIFDEQFNVCPINREGDLYIGGDCLAEGYFNKPELTAERFIDNPWIPGERMYKTGDRARWMTDGNMEFLGRLDDQVKIRGFRIELGEIEAQLLNNPAIEEAVVVAREKDSDKHLVAYCVASESIQIGEIREHLSDKVPEYMIPSYYVQVSEMPLTSNGKVNKKALPEPEAQVMDDYQAPANELEAHLVKIWSDVLNLEASLISTGTSFFELGGHSFRAIAMVNQLAQSLSVDISLREVFRHQDIQSLASFISEQVGETQQEMIVPAELKDHYVASPTQRRMYMLNQINQTSVAYNMPRVMKLSGEVDATHLRNAFQQLTDRHEVLRTSFHGVDQELVQKITPELTFELEIHATEKSKIDQHFSAFIRPFDLSQAPLIRAGLVQVVEADKVVENYLMVDIHHIVTDGVSQGILIQDFISLYNNEQLLELDLHYKDYSEWYRSHSIEGEMSRQRQFWLSEYSEALETLDVPTDYPRKATRSHQGDALYIELNENLTGKLRDLAEEEGATSFMVLLAAFNVVIAKLTNSSDIVVGTPVGGRQHAALERMVGVFINTLPLRNRPEGRKTFSEFLAEVKSNTLGALENQNYPFEELVEELELKRDTSRNPVFDFLFAYQNFEEVTDQMQGLEVESVSFEHRVSKFDWTLTAVEGEESILFASEYASELFEEETIRRFVAYLERTLEQVVDNKEITLGAVNILSEDEERQLLQDFNQTEVDHGDRQTLIALLKNSVANSPENTALAHREQELSYSELDRLSDKLACALRQSKVSGATIGLMCNRSIEQVIGLIGIMKAGYSYLPLDPDQPEARVIQLTKSSNVSTVLTNEKIEVEGIDFIDLEGILSSEVSTVQLPVIKPNDIAYIIYTSGSTGLPKGVMVPHRAAANLIVSQANTFAIDESERVLQFSPMIFDPSVEQTWLALGSGATLVLVDKETIADTVAFESYVTDQEVTHLHGTPSFLENLELSGTNSIRRIVSGGEPCSPALAEKFVERYDFFNKYGPTEATITSTVHQVLPDQIDPEGIPIGKPVANTRLYVLNEDGQLQPKGVRGELYIGGVGVASGYVSNEQATADRFTWDPFHAGGRLYKTGDMVKWRADGTLQFLGRADDQVKIRGFRIEPGEITHHLKAFAGIESAHTLVKGDSNDQYLVGYYASPSAIDQDLIQRFLSERLPSYMVPTHFVNLVSMPLTVNGKINKSALPDPDNAHLTIEKPENEIEEGILSIWAEVLKLDPGAIGVTNSFYELGGHSLRAMVTLNKVNKQFGVEMDLRTFFTRPTIRGIAGFIKSLTPAESSSEAIENQEEFTF